MVFGAGFGVQIESSGEGLLVMLRGWEPWMLLGFILFLFPLGLTTGLGLGRQLGRVEATLRARARARGKVSA